MKIHSEMCFFKQCKQDFHPGSDTDSAGDNNPCTQPTRCKRTWILRPVCLQWKTSAGNCCTSSIDSGSTLIMEPTKWMATTSSTDPNQSVGTSFRYFYFGIIIPTTVCTDTNGVEWIWPHFFYLFRYHCSCCTAKREPCLGYDPNLYRYYNGRSLFYPFWDVSLSGCTISTSDYQRKI